MLLIKKSFIAQEKEISLETYLEERFSLTVVNNQQKMLFLQDMVQSYIIDERHRKLIAAPDSTERMIQIKNLLGEVWLDEAYPIYSTYKQRCYNMANNFISAPAKLSGEVAVYEDNRLLGTANHIQNIYEAKNQFFELSLAENEMISSVKTEIELNGQKIVSKMEIVSVEDAIMPNAFRDFLTYEVATKAA